MPTENDILRAARQTQSLRDALADADFLGERERLARVTHPSYGVWFDAGTCRLTVAEVDRLAGLISARQSPSAP